MTKKKMFWQVRYWPAPEAYSKSVGFKGRVLEIGPARKAVKRLKAAGVAAFRVPFPIVASV